MAPWWLAPSHARSQAPRALLLETAPAGLLSATLQMPGAAPAPHAVTTPANIYTLATSQHAQQQLASPAHQQQQQLQHAAMLLNPNAGSAAFHSTGGGGAVGGALHSSGQHALSDSVLRKVMLPAGGAGPAGFPAAPLLQQPSVGLAPAAALGGLSVRQALAAGGYSSGGLGLGGVHRGGLGGVQGMGLGGSTGSKRSGASRRRKAKMYQALNAIVQVSLAAVGSLAARQPAARVPLLARRGSLCASCSALGVCICFDASAGLSDVSQPCRPLPPI